MEEDTQPKIFDETDVQSDIGKWAKESLDQQGDLGLFGDDDDDHDDDTGDTSSIIKKESSLISPEQRKAVQHSEPKTKKPNQRKFDHEEDGTLHHKLQENPHRETRGRRTQSKKYPPNVSQSTYYEPNGYNDFHDRHQMREERFEPNSFKFQHPRDNPVSPRVINQGGPKEEMEEFLHDINFVVEALQIVSSNHCSGSNEVGQSIRFSNQTLFEVYSCEEEATERKAIQFMRKSMRSLRTNVEMLMQQAVSKEIEMLAQKRDVETQIRQNPTQPTQQKSQVNQQLHQSKKESIPPLAPASNGLAPQSTKSHQQQPINKPSQTHQPQTTHTQRVVSQQRPQPLQGTPMPPRQSEPQNTRPAQQKLDVVSSGEMASCLYTENSQLGGRAPEFMLRPDLQQRSRQSQPLQMQQHPDGKCIVS